MEVVGERERERLVLLVNHACGGWFAGGFVETSSMSWGAWSCLCFCFDTCLGVPKNFLNGYFILVILESKSNIICEDSL